MPRQNPGNSAINRFRRFINATKSLVSPPRKAVGDISPSSQPSTTEPDIDISKKPEKQTPVRPADPDRFIIFSDTDNDLESVKNTLRFAGAFDQNDELTNRMEGITIVHTGDMISKNRPAPHVVEYWEALKEDASRQGCRIKLIAGNHEQETWRRMKAGKKHGIAPNQLDKLNSFIEGLDLFYVVGPILFMHGYPTTEFLQALLHYREVTGRDLNRFNKDHYKKSLISVRAMKQYAYLRAGKKINHLLYDVTDAENYYKKNGGMIDAILSQLEIEIIVHGHKPQRSGSQADYEYKEWIPNVRIINNDTNVSRKGIGATVIRKTSSGSFEIVFVNSKDQSEAFAMKVRKILGMQCEATAENPSVVANHS